MSWSGVKQQANKAEIEAWCEKMGIENYTINAQGEIDVNGSVNLDGRDIKELPCKFGMVTGFFSVNNCNLISLKNCPQKVGMSFSCSLCNKLDSLEGCPKEVGWNFFCRNCKREFTKKEVRSLCKVDTRYLIYN